MGDQLTFMDVFEAAAEEAANAHLPSTLATALPFYREMLGRYNAAIMSADFNRAAAIDNEAHALARHLNNNDPGILAGPDAPGYLLMRGTAASTGDTPLWGQAGDFNVAVDGMKVRVTTDGLLGIGGSAGFAAHAVEMNRPFLSDTAFRSFLGCRIEDAHGCTFYAFAVTVMRSHIARELEGKLSPIQPRYRQGATLDAE